MRADRDSFLLLISLVPAGFVVYCFLTWKSTGTWPAGVPNLNVSIPSPPSWITQNVQLPPSVVALLHRARETWPVMIAGLGAGLWLGIMAIGTLADIVRGLGNRLFARPTEALVPEEAEPELVTSSPGIYSVRRPEVE